MQAQFIQKGPDTYACGAAVDDAQPVGRAVGQQEVVKNRQVLDVRHFLERGMNTQSMRRFGVADADACAQHLNLSAVGRHQPGQQFDQRRFAGPVLAQQRVGAAACDGDGNIVHRTGGSVGLADLLYLDRYGLIDSRRLSPSCHGLYLARGAPQVV